MLNMGAKVKCYHVAFTCMCILGKSLNFCPCKVRELESSDLPQFELSALQKKMSQHRHLFIHEAGYEPQPSFKHHPSPPLLPQGSLARYTARLRVETESLFALFESSVDACHIWSAQYHHSAR